MIVWGPSDTVRDEDRWPMGKTIVVAVAMGALGWLCVAGVFLL